MTASAKLSNKEMFRRERKRRQLIARLFWGASAALVVLVLGYAGWRAVKPKLGVSVPVMSSSRHIDVGAQHEPYNSDPPTSGPHMPRIADWGAYDKPIPKEYQVHNLEDGGVVIQYHCPKGCPNLVKKLESVFFKYKTRAEKEKKYMHLILAPYPDMDALIALTAWTRLDKLNDFDEARIDRFIEAYIGIDHHKKDGGR